MNPTIEYFFRKKMFLNMLTIPCSLFLFNHKEQERIIISIVPKNETILIVKKWNLESCQHKNILPPHEEIYIENKNVLTNPEITGNDLFLMKYYVKPYPAGTRQYSTYPYVITQKAEYESYLDNFYNSIFHKEKRENTLWQEFKKTHIQEMQKMKISINPLHSIFGESSLMSDYRNQKKKLSIKNKILWKNWNYWKKNMLFNDNYAAAELVFQESFQDRIYEF